MEIINYNQIKPLPENRYVDEVLQIATAYKIRYDCYRYDEALCYYWDEETNINKLITYGCLFNTRYNSTKALLKCAELALSEKFKNDFSEIFICMNNVVEQKATINELKLIRKKHKIM